MGALKERLLNARDQHLEHIKVAIMDPIVHEEHSCEGWKL